MSDSDSVSEWLRGLEDGDADAAQKLWDRFFKRLMLHADNRIGRALGGRVEAEDIAASVFESLYIGAQQGRFQSVKNRDELWWLLMKLAHRKLINAVRFETAEKRGGRNRPISLNNDRSCGFFAIVSREPTPDDVIVLGEELERVLTLLPEERLKKIAQLTLEGLTVIEISQQLGIATVTVTRKRKLIRSIWLRDLQE